MTEPSLLEFEDLLPLASQQDLMQWFDALHQADQTFSDMMTVEIWSMVQTMDAIIPGFWSQYMANRQAIVQQFLEERRNRHLHPAPLHPLQAFSTVKNTGSSRPLSPWTATITDDQGERVSYFAGNFEADLARLDRSTPTAETSPPEVFEILHLPSGLDEAVEAIGTPETEPQIQAKPMPVEQRKPYSPSHQPNALGDPVTPSTLVLLPHLMIPPTIKAGSEDADPYGLVRLAVACWLTSHFWTLDSPEDPVFSRQQTDSFRLGPGQSVICSLGFQLNGISSPVKVTLARSLRAEFQLSATWMADLPRIPAALRRQMNAECGIQLHNRGDRDCLLQAGSPFCRLEFFWANPTHQRSNRSNMR